jgi:hypothetical protein
MTQKTLTESQEKMLVAEVEKAFDMRSAEVTKHLLACVAVRTLQLNGWLSEPDVEVQAPVFQVTRGSGIRAKHRKVWVATQNLNNSN